VTKSEYEQLRKRREQLKTVVKSVGNVIHKRMAEKELEHVRAQLQQAHRQQYEQNRV